MNSAGSSPAPDPRQITPSLYKGASSGLAYDEPLASDRGVKNPATSFGSSDLAPSLADILVRTQQAAMKSQTPAAPVAGTVLSGQVPPSVNWGQALPQQPMAQQPIVPSQNLSTISVGAAGPASQPQRPIQQPSMYQRWAARHVAKGRPV